MNISIYPIKSLLHDQEYLDKKREELLSSLTNLTSDEYRIVDINHLYEGELAFILVESGGSEGYFLEVFDKLKEPIYLLTYGSNNSLAASLEILSFIHLHSLKGEILHGGERYIAKRIKELKQCD